MKLLKAILQVDVNIDEGPELETSEEEWEGYYTVKSICSEIIDPDRVAIRDRKGYCNVLLDNNQYYPIVKLHFNNPKNLRVEFYDAFKVYSRGKKKAIWFQLVQ